MKQQFRIYIYFTLIFALAFCLVRYVQFPFDPASWRLKSFEEVVVVDVDSTAKLSELDVDSEVVQPVPIEKDTVITKEFLSCPSQFLKQLNRLNAALQQTSTSNKNIRILHYGDSQIEGDRITAYLREAFQKRYGGSGPGLITVFDPQRINPSVWLDNKGEWKISTVYNRKHRIADKSYGLMGQTASLDGSSYGIFKISASHWAEEHASHYQKVRLFIAPHTDSLNIKGTIKDTEVINDVLPPSSALTEINWEFEQLSPTIKFELNSLGRVHILGCALDSINGVSVDNIALRGQSSPLLHRTNGDLYKAMSEHMDIGMVIFQFGANIIPTVAPNYHFYKVQLSKQFKFLQEYLPNVPVVVVGISDAAHINEGQLSSYQHLSRIRDAQKAIALEFKFAFFDLYQAMGGEGSIIKWTEKNPPWALTDYLHFSRRGGKEVAAYLSKALWQHIEQPQSSDTCLFTESHKPCLIY
ncbi:hypothetical protein [Carboxylicivirga sp. M1479]|uniref:hypothetical protein n=1 Tax=Carboxylicivirga sp. M1479 TaxID=2594476 RepID=UPI0011781255|nr:hypothetical protein [Carboxylicivirga sp. M1479]TRX72207.1 hypothetical protein FNN09_02215 [Carboxylicivirga sp. M1479]